MTPSEPYWRYATPRDLDAPTFGPRVEVVGRALGTPLMPHQQWIADVAGEHDGQGRYKYQFVVVTMPRRGGKTALCGAVGLERMLRTPDYPVYFTAQTQGDAGERFDELIKLVRRSPFAAHATPRFAAGNKRITLPNQSTWRIFKPAPDAVHGGVVGTAMLDEAFDLDEQTGHGIIGAIRPAQLTMDGRGQIWIVSTEGHAASSFLRYWIDLGREQSPGVALFEIGAPADADPMDPATWATYHPAHGHTLETDDLATEAAVMDRSEFVRAYLNIRTAAKSALIDGAQFAELARVCASPPTGRVTISFDVGYGRVASTVLATWDTPEGTAHKIVRHAPGIEWVAPTVVEVAAGLPGPVTLAADDGGDARQIIDELTRAGETVHTLNLRDLSTAFSRWLDRLARARITHDGTEPMIAAAAALTSRVIGDATVPSRAHSPGDISPIIAAIAGEWTTARAVPDDGPTLEFGAA